MVVGEGGRSSGVLLYRPVYIQYVKTRCIVTGLVSVAITSMNGHLSENCTDFAGMICPKNYRFMLSSEH